MSKDFGRTLRKRPFYFHRQGWSSWCLVLLGFLGVFFLFQGKAVSIPDASKSTFFVEVLKLEWSRQLDTTQEPVFLIRNRINDAVFLKEGEKKSENLFEAHLNWTPPQAMIIELYIIEKKNLESDGDGVLKNIRLGLLKRKPYLIRGEKRKFEIRAFDHSELVRSAFQELTERSTKQRLLGSWGSDEPMQGGSNDAQSAVSIEEPLFCPDLMNEIKKWNQLSDKELEEIFRFCRVETLALLSAPQKESIGIALYNGGRFSLSKKYLEETNKNQGLSREGILYLALVEEALGNFVVASQLFQQAVQRRGTEPHPTDSVSLFFWGRFQFNRGELLLAQDTFHLVLQEKLLTPELRSATEDFLKRIQDIEKNRLESLKERNKAIGVELGFGYDSNPLDINFNSGATMGSSFLRYGIFFDAVLSHDKTKEWLFTSSLNDRTFYEKLGFSAGSSFLQSAAPLTFSVSSPLVRRGLWSSALTYQASASPSLYLVALSDENSSSKKTKILGGGYRLDLMIRNMEKTSYTQYFTHNYERLQLSTDPVVGHVLSVGGSYFQGGLGSLLNQWGLFWDLRTGLYPEDLLKSEELGGGISFFRPLSDRSQNSIKLGHKLQKWPRFSNGERRIYSTRIDYGFDYFMSENTHFSALFGYDMRISNYPDDEFNKWLLDIALITRVPF